MDLWSLETRELEAFGVLSEVRALLWALRFLHCVDPLDEASNIIYLEYGPVLPHNLDSRHSVYNIAHCRSDHCTQRSFLLVAKMHLSNNSHMRK